MSILFLTVATRSNARGTGGAERNVPRDAVCASVMGAFLSDIMRSAWWEAADEVKVGRGEGE
ncbi:MAG: hypothetical protein FJ221_03420 [Lentisphaerae bacterium]|nr:hypothetical protein [Lentisphaerota bacterium]